MRVHPYRSRPDASPSSPMDGFEERAVAVVLVIAGALGLAIGTVAPNTNATELVLGIGLLGIGVQTYRRPRSAPVV